MSIFKRMFKFTQSEAHAVMDKIEDPIKMTEQGIRDLQKDLKDAMVGLAEVKGMAINTRKQADNAAKRAADYEKKAMMLLQKMQSGELDPAEAERLATAALGEKETQSGEHTRLAGEADHHEKLAAQLQANVNKIKSTITSYQNDLTTLKARAKTAAATKRINEQVAQIDSSGTVAMLEKMKAKVEADEALATAYGDVAGMETSVDAELDNALKGAASPQADQLAALKAKMGITGLALMGLFDFIKGNLARKSDSNYHLELATMSVGCYVDYDMESWKVEGAHRYDFDGEISLEWKLVSASRTLFLQMEEDDEREWSMSQNIAYNDLDEKIRTTLTEQGDPPNKIVHQGITYHLETVSAGHFLPNGQQNPNAAPQEMIAWDFESSNGEHYLTIEQWGENEFSANTGFPVEEYQFTNILPAG